jgi:hypothetical protein
MSITIIITIITIIIITIITRTIIITFIITIIIMFLAAFKRHPLSALRWVEIIEQPTQYYLQGGAGSTPCRPESTPPGPEST